MIVTIDKKLNTVTIDWVPGYLDGIHLDIREAKELYQILKAQDIENIEVENE